MTIIDTIEFRTAACCKCGMAFALTKDFDRRRREDHALFYCPAGHAQHYSEESEAEKLRRERDRLAQEVARVEQEAKDWRATAESQREQREAAEREAKALKKRAAAGTCPCCHRTFRELSDHMQRQHPGFRAEQVAGPRDPLAESAAPAPRRARKPAPAA